ncbi:MAG: DUF1598 domain-containing protein [Planctomycetes bacterium]|nr:DUF1598 domain-containing protein [Planctomycetota bacterium]MBL7037937.1 DUF1598 domain-containing protein [Pirellulaceae bacterium]
MIRFHASQKLSTDVVWRNAISGMVCFAMCALIMCAPRLKAQQGNTTVQLPTFGVAIDAVGLLSVKSFPDPLGRLHAARVAAARAGLPRDIAVPSDMRMVSLLRLEKAVGRAVAAGGQPDEMMRNLAGLQSLRYVFFYPDEPDIVIAGPAEGWVADASGRVVGIKTGRPVLRLDDLVVALRAYAPGSNNRPFIGCTIDPNRDGLARLQKFQQTIPRTIPQRARQQVAARIAQGSAESLGMANIRVFGISANTHFAQVMIEADYRMKLIGVGLEPPPTRMTTFIGALTVPQHSMLQRWWFTPRYDCVRVTKDRQAMELVGEAVQLLAEDKLVGPDGQLAPAAAKPSKASELFTMGFTRKYPEIAARSPVYAQLRNLIDMLVAAAFIRQQDFYGQASWNLGVLGDETALPVQTVRAAERVPCVVNTVWKGNRLLSPAGGGVSIRADVALEPDRLLADENGKVAERYRNIGLPADKSRWWWD